MGPAAIHSGRRGFTLVELLVVVAIIALLIAMLMPSLAGAREEARRVACLSQLKQVGSAIIMYVGESDQYLPGPSWYGQTPRYNHNSQNITRYLAVYLGMPTPSSRSDVTPMFICPAAAPYKPAAFALESTHMFGADGLNESTGLRLFGYPTFEGRPWYPPSKVSAVRRPAQQYAVRDIDGFIHPGGWNGAVLSQPGHGFSPNFQPMRNYLFFDTHVELRYDAR